MAAARGHRGSQHFIRRKLLHQEADADDIRYSVHRADFMKMDFRYRAAVHFAFRIRDQGIDGFGVRLYPGGNLQGINQFIDVLYRGMMMVRMLMVMRVIMVMIVPVIVVMRMFVFMVMPVFMTVIVIMIVVMIVSVLMGVIRIDGFLLHAIHGYAHMRSGDAALDGRFGGHMHPGQAERIHLINKRLFILCQFQQRGGEHIACSAHIAFQVKGFHRFSLLVCSGKVQLSP
jgi:hypothetical protein